MDRCTQDFGLQYATLTVQKFRLKVPGPVITGRGWGMGLVEHSEYIGPAVGVPLPLWGGSWLRAKSGFWESCLSEASANLKSRKRVISPWIRGIRSKIYFIMIKSVEQISLKLLLYRKFWADILGWKKKRRRLPGVHLSTKNWPLAYICPRKTECAGRISESKTFGADGP